MLQPSHSCALECFECGGVVGTEGPQRGTLLLPCQHVLHMGCVEFIKRRGKLLMGMDSADVEQDEGGESIGTSFATETVTAASGSNASLSQQMHGRCLCPACFVPVTNFIPLYLRSEDDPGAPSKSTTNTDGSVDGAGASAAVSSTLEEDYTRVHAAQKRVLLRLRGLCEQRRRMTELTRTCANLHEQRARYLADVEKEERCFPGLISSDVDKKPDAHADAACTNTSGSRRMSSSSSPQTGLSSLPIEHMGITELELYMAQVTPRLLRTQAEVRKERQLVERRTKKLNALRAHYHSTKELHALDAEIAERQAQERGGVRRNVVHLDRIAPSSPPHPHPQLPSMPPEEAQQPQCSFADEVTAPSLPSINVPARKRQRGEEAIDVDDEQPTEVVEILSQDSTGDASEPEVTFVDIDNTDTDAEAGYDGGVEFMEERGDNSYDAPYLIPCYVRPPSSAASYFPTSAEPKAPRTTLTHRHIRMLPRREDRLWQSSLQF
jgi:hypothetical protein